MNRFYSGDALGPDGRIALPLFLGDKHIGPAVERFECLLTMQMTHWRQEITAISVRFLLVGLPAAPAHHSLYRIKLPADLLVERPHYRHQMWLTGSGYINSVGSLHNPNLGSRDSLFPCRGVYETIKLPPVSFRCTNMEPVNYDAGLRDDRAFLSFYSSTAALMRQAAYERLTEISTRGEHPVLSLQLCGDEPR